jgi:enoyl-CoA hydratase/3-hydroxyacyl-CoA dehydrogenase
MPVVLGQQRDKGQPFPVKFVQEEQVEDLRFLTFYRPGVMNALNEEVLDQLEAAFDRAVTDDSVKGIVLRGAGKAFVAGADIRFLVDALEAKDLWRIRSFTEKAHRVLNKVDRAPKPVMVQLDGVTLGGGFGLALAADYIVASPEASVGFPETGLGLYPGLGGMQRTARRVGIGLARYLVLTGHTLDARTARQVRLFDALVDRKDLNRVFHQLVEIGPRGEEAWGVAPAMEDVLARHSEVWKDVAASFRTLDLETALAGKAAVGGDLMKDARPVVEHGLRSLRAKAPMALRIADRLIREGAETSLVQGLKMELASLEEIFGTEDAYEGLKALMEKRRPEYKGR